MAFVIEIPSISDTINGNQLNLVVGGVKAYNLDNLYSKKGTDEHFKIFIGFQNKVCTNLCVWTDGYMADLKVNNLRQLLSSSTTLFQSYNEAMHLSQMRQLTEYSLTEQQFAKLIGRCRMYSHLPVNIKKDIQPLHFGDSQIGMLVKDYYRDINFSRDGSTGSINLWNLYNLFTGTNKSSYIDTFLDREVSAFQFADDLRKGLETPGNNWFLS